MAETFTRWDAAEHLRTQEDISPLTAAIAPAAGSGRSGAKSRTESNTCLRCRSCGHIFSPGPRTLRATQRDAV